MSIIPVPRQLLLDVAEVIGKLSRKVIGTDRGWESVNAVLEGIGVVLRTTPFQDESGLLAKTERARYDVLLQEERRLADAERKSITKKLEKALAECHSLENYVTALEDANAGFTTSNDLDAWAAARSGAAQRKLVRDPIEGWREETDAELRARLLGKRHGRMQACGCVLCICEDAKQCRGCGASLCKAHELQAQQLRTGVVPWPY